VRGVLAATRMLPRLLAQRASAPRDTTVLYKLAAAYALTQQYDEARATLDALRAVAPGHASARALAASLPAP
jgi:predicted Zn-dependent protease